MKPGTFNPPIIWRGCWWEPTSLIWKDPEGNPYNLASWTPVAQTINGFSLNAVKIDAANGVTQMGNIDGSVTAKFKLGVYQWDWIFWIPDTGFKFAPFLSGVVEVKDPKTHVSAFIPPPH